MDINLDSRLDGSKELHNILFSRPVGIFGKPSISIILGRHTKLSELSIYYEVFDAFGINPVIITDHSLASAIPGSIVLKSRDSLHYQNSDEAMEVILNNKALLILTGSEASASLELFINQLSKSFNGFVVVDNKKLLKMPWGSDARLCIGDYSKLVPREKSKNQSISGLKQKSEELLALSQEYNMALLALSQAQAIGVCHRFGSEVGVINTKDQIIQSALTGILVALLAERDEPLDENWMKYVLASGYLYRNFYSKGGVQELRQYLNSQF